MYYLIFMKSRFFIFKSVVIAALSLFLTSCIVDYVTGYKVDVVFRNESSHAVTLEFHRLSSYPDEPVMIPAGESRTFNMSYSVDGKNVPMKKGDYVLVVPGSTKVTFEGLETIEHEYFTPNSISSPNSYEAIDFNPKERYQKIGHTLTDEDYDYALSQQPLTEWELLLVDATEIVNQAIADYGDYKAEEVAELLCGKKWSMNSHIKYDEEWQKIIDVYFLKKYAYYEGYNPSSDFQFLEDGTITESILMDIDGADVPYLREGTWQFLAESHTIEIVWSLDDGRNRIESYLLQALGEDCFLWDSSRMEENERYIYKAKQTTN